MKQPKKLNMWRLAGCSLTGEWLTGSDSGAERHRKFLLAALVAILTFMVYLPALRNGFVSWDDGLFVYENTRIFKMDAEFFRWAITDTSIDYWRPLSWISHAFDYALWGLDPFGHHLTNIIFHAINTVLVFFLTCKILAFMDSTACDASGFSSNSILLAAGLAGALFGLHPLHVESVAWVSERKDLLYAMFYLLGLIGYTSYISSLAERDVAASFFRNGRYYATLTLFFLSLCSKPMAITFPAVLLLLDWYPFRRDFKASGIKRLLVEKTPFIALSAVVAVSTLIAQKNVGAMVDSTDLSYYARLLISFRSLVLYLWKIIAPIDLLALYPYPEVISLANPQLPAAIACVVLITAGCLIMVRRTKIWLVAWGYFLATVFPVLGLVQSGPQPMADRYMYLPLLGPCILLGVGVARMEKYCAELLLLKKIMWSVVVLVMALLGFLTVQQIRTWKSNISLWTHVIDKEPGRVPIAYHNRALAMMAMGNYDQAIDDSSHAISLNPEYHDAYHNRGNAFSAKGQYDRAIADYNKAIKLKPADPVIYNSRGLLFARRGEFDRALEDYGKSISLKPDYMEAYNNRGLAYAGKGELSHAINDYNRASDLNPDDASIQINRGIAFAAMGRIDLAENEYSSAIKLKPTPPLAANAHSNRGILRFNRREYDRALEDFNSAVTLDPGSVAAYNNRGALYRAMGDYAHAAADFTRMLELNPGLEKAYLDRGDTYLEGGRPAMAKDDYLAACRMGSTAGCRKADSLP